MKDRIPQDIVLEHIQGPTKEQIKLWDDYPTPISDARYLVSLLNIRPGSTILEPHANKGNFIKAIRAEVPRARIYANELQKVYIPTLRSMGLEGVRRGDFLTMTDKKRFDWVVANPPFTKNKGIAHVLHALTLADNVAMLLPLRYISSAGRYPFWRQNPAKVIWSIAERPVFVGTSGGRTDYAWYWWRTGHTGRVSLRFISLD